MQVLKTLIFASCILALAACKQSPTVNKTSETVKPLTEPKTKIEAFQAKTGVVIIKGMSDVGSIKDIFKGLVLVSAREFVDAASSEKVYGLIVQVKESGTLKNEKSSFVDYDEIDSLIKGIDYVSKIEKTVTKLSDFEAAYSTKG